jgi:hypothetical protein
MGISLRSLAPRLGLSVASLFGYRSGKIPISAKAWSKLERAEQEAKRARREAAFAEKEGKLNEFPVPKWDDPSNLKDAPWGQTQEQPVPHDLEARIRLLEVALSGLEAQAAMIRQDLCRLKNEFKR